MSNVGSGDDVAVTIVKELYRSLLGREPDPRYLKQHADKLRSEGIEGGVSNAISYFLATEEFQRRAIDPNRLAPKILHNSSQYYQQQVNRDFAASIPAGSLVLDVGAGQAPFRNLFKQAHYETVDFEKVKGIRGEHVCLRHYGRHTGRG
jgi:hypothetical protein